METILITGGTGNIGKELSSLLLSRGYCVAVLTRKKNIQDSRIKHFHWDVKNKTIEKGAFEHVTTIVHLAGANIGEKRWSEKRKNEIYNSRVLSVKFLLEYIKEHDIKINHIISASAIGYYGAINSELIYTEDNCQGHDFLAKTCFDLETATLNFNHIGVQTSILRIGVVLSLYGGLMKKTIKYARKHINPKLGTGSQYINWIHIEDLCRIFVHTIEQSIYGVYNAVATEKNKNVDFTQSVSRILQKPNLSPSIPSFFLKIVFGEMASILLYGSRVSNDKIKKTDYTFKFDQLDSALKNLLIK